MDAALLLMQRIGAQVRVAFQALPIPVAGDDGDLLNLIAALKQAACPFVAQVVEVKILDPKTKARTAK